MTSVCSVVELGTPLAKHAPAQSILLHLVPGGLALGVYVAAVPLAGWLGLPTIAALAISGLLGVVPVQLALLSCHRRTRPHEAAVQLRTKLPLRRMLGWVLLEVMLAALAFLVTGPLVRWLSAEAFVWWPTSLIINTGTEPSYGTGALAATALLMLLGSVLTAPMVEECYFRGYLLPRMPADWGRGGPVAHAALFAGYHLWTPWLMPARLLAILPLTLIALRTRDIRIGIATHAILNSVDVAILTRYLLSR
jgi:membrane protease YdiL (CAAX protease family)